MNILDTIKMHKIKEVKAMSDAPYQARQSKSLIDKIHQNDKIAVIAEIKKGSPSKGYFSKSLDYIRQAKLYEENGASCISVLTDHEFFLWWL